MSETSEIVVKGVLLFAVGLEIAFVAFYGGWSEAMKRMPEQSNAIIETHDGIDYAVLDHDGVHYVIELGGAE